MMLSATAFSILIRALVIEKKATNLADARMKMSKKSKVHQISENCSILELVKTSLTTNQKKTFW